MMICSRCGKGFETTSLCFGIVERPTSRLVVEVGKDRISKTMPLCPDCTQTALHWLEGGEQDAQQHCEQASAPA